MILYKTHGETVAFVNTLHPIASNQPAKPTQLTTDTTDGRSRDPQTHAQTEPIEHHNGHGPVPGFVGTMEDSASTANA